MSGHEEPEAVYDALPEEEEENLAEVVEADEAQATNADETNNAATTSSEVVVEQEVKVDMFGCIKTLLQNKLVGYHCPKPSCGRLDYGWFWPSHQVVFRCLLSEETAVILELGSFLGRSTSFLLAQCPQAVVFAVDLWDNEYLKKDDHYKTSEQQVIASYPLFETFLVNTWQHRLRVKDKRFTGLVPVRMSTVEAMRLLHAAGVRPDFIYVDANHHYDAVLEDVRTCLELFPGAAICGDDYDYKDVRRAVHDLARERGLRVAVEENKCWTFAGLDEDRRAQARVKTRTESSSASATSSSSSNKRQKVI